MILKVPKIESVFWSFQLFCKFLFNLKMPHIKLQIPQGRSAEMKIEENESAMKLDFT